MLMFCRLYFIMYKYIYLFHYKIKDIMLSTKKHSHSIPSLSVCFEPFCLVPNLSVRFQAFPFGSKPYCSILSLFHSVPSLSIRFRAFPFASGHFRSIPSLFVRFRAVTFDSERLRSNSFGSEPFRTIPSFSVHFQAFPLFPSLSVRF